MNKLTGSEARKLLIRGSMSDEERAAVIETFAHAVLTHFERTGGESTAFLYAITRLSQALPCDNPELENLL